MSAQQRLTMASVTYLVNHGLEPEIVRVCNNLAFALRVLLNKEGLPCPLDEELDGWSFEIPILNDYTLSVSVPADKNRYVLIEKCAGIVVETALFKNGRFAYEPDLGYECDVREFTYCVADICAEYNRVKDAVSARS